VKENDVNFINMPKVDLPVARSGYGIYRSKIWNLKFMVRQVSIVNGDAIKRLAESKWSQFC
jgi:hypothetical protein